MKRLLSFVIVIIVAFSLAACGGKDSKGGSIDVSAAAEAVKAVEINGEKPFSDFKLESADYLTRIVGVDASLLSDFAAVISSDDMNSRMVLLLTPSEGNRDEVKNQVSNALASYQKRWDNYLPEQAGVVADRMETEIGDCLIYIISDDNDAVLDAVRSAQK